MLSPLYRKCGLYLRRTSLRAIFALTSQALFVAVPIMGSNISMAKRLGSSRETLIVERQEFEDPPRHLVISIHQALRVRLTSVIVAE